MAKTPKTKVSSVKGKANSAVTGHKPGSKKTAHVTSNGHTARTSTHEAEERKTGLAAMFLKSEVIENQPETDKQGETVEEMGGNAARNDTARSRVRDENGNLELRQGQPCVGSKLDDSLEEKLCRYIASGISWTDSSILAGIDRSTIHRWKEKGIQDPESRYGRFLEKIELAEVTSKAYLINKIRHADDWRGAWRLLCSQYPKEFRDHVVNELTGPEGAPLAVGNTAFKVEFHLGGEPDIKFTTVNHQEAERLPDPASAYIKPKS